jgi:hypothetical protein
MLAKALYDPATIWIIERIEDTIQLINHAVKHAIELLPFKKPSIDDTPWREEFAKFDLAWRLRIGIASSSLRTSGQ